ncbi:hypothetical protein P4571_07935 [Niallia alba]|uniref:hypothetical protein n=1 Tax=Niallia alba TaxID=2729105 RepID=UPI002E2153D4|nr:hypothetical protein [Niallia alba]
MGKYTVRGLPIQNKDEALLALCYTANINCLPIDELWCYKDICSEFGITSQDYYNDEESLSEEHLDNAGNNNWKPIFK